MHSISWYAAPFFCHLVLETTEHHDFRVVLGSGEKAPFSPCLSLVGFQNYMELFRLCIGTFPITACFFRRKCRRFLCRRSCEMPHRFFPLFFFLKTNAPGAFWLNFGRLENTLLSLVSSQNYMELLFGFA